MVLYQMLMVIFMLSVSPNAKLQFSFVGYIGQVIAIGEKRTLNVVLKEDNKTLEEVVVVGYGNSEKSGFIIGYSCSPY